MLLGEQALDFAVQAPRQQTRKALGSSLMSLLGLIGAERYACLYLRRDAGGVTIERSISNVPRQWLDLYLERGYDATDPVFQGAVRSSSYGYWTEMTRSFTLNKANREVMSAAREFDMKDGFTKRVMLENGGAAVMMAAGEELDRSDRTRAALRMVFDVFANEGLRMLKLTELREEDQGEHRALSKMQLKVLVLRAEGLSNKQVAQELGRHEKTVECHVTEILQRLEARNMIDAIRIATKRKLIL
jgi:DNA-binding NarL/FixJ family response regulator